MTGSATTDPNDPTPLEIAQGITARSGYTRSVGVRVIQAAPGSIDLGLNRRPELLQFNGYFHGGVIAGLADHAAGGAVTLALPRGTSP